MAREMALKRVSQASVFLLGFFLVKRLLSVAVRGSIAKFFGAGPITGMASWPGAKII